ncbi:MAG: SAP domain-containing protein [Sterolibacterium sp.]|nr:SAP domain-containing protein [Sterolibacterium sp.]
MMTQKELLKLAKKYHVSHSGLSNIELIRKLQQSEGNFDCYARAVDGVCDQSECLWRDGCLTESAGCH